MFFLEYVGTIDYSGNKEKLSLEVIRMRTWLTPDSHCSGSKGVGQAGRIPSARTGTPILQLLRKREAST